MSSLSAKIPGEYPSETVVLIYGNRYIPVLRLCPALLSTPEESAGCDTSF
jgi:hypothetical protein